MWNSLKMVSLLDFLFSVILTQVLPLTWDQNSFFFFNSVLSFFPHCQGSIRQSLLFHVTAAAAGHCHFMTQGMLPTPLCSLWHCWFTFQKHRLGSFLAQKLSSIPTIVWALCLTSRLLLVPAPSKSTFPSHTFQNEFRAVDTVVSLCASFSHAQHSAGRDYCIPLPTPQAYLL